MRARATGLAALLPPLGWLAAFVLLPLAIVVRISLSEPATAQPPYRPQLPATWDGAAWLDALSAFGAGSYRTLAADTLYLEAAIGSLGIALAATALLAGLGLPLALALVRAPPRARAALLLLVTLPFWTSFLVRVYAWIAILRDDGWLNAVLLGLGLVDEPVRILNTQAAVLIGTVYAYLPFMVLPLFAVLERRDPALVEAAADLGAGRWRIFRTVTLPLAAPGLAAGALLCFIPIVGEFVIPDLLGGSDTLMLGHVLWSEFFSNRDWPLASAIAVATGAVLFLPIWLVRSAEARGIAASSGRGGARR